MYEKPDAPASIGGVLDNGFKLLKASFSKVVGISIVASLVSQMPSMALMSSVDADGVPQGGGALLVIVLLAMVFSIILYGAIVGRMHSVHAGREMTTSQAFSLGLSCMLPLIGFFILYALAIMGGSLLLLIPGLILAVTLMFGSYILIIDRAGVMDSLKQSHRLVWGYWWHTAAIVGVAGIIVMVCYVLVGFVAGIALAVNPDSIGTGAFSLTETLLTGVLGGILTPIFYALSLSAYYDLRLRREGDDLASRIEAAPTPA
jgi:hypothetical protein